MTDRNISLFANRTAFLRSLGHQLHLHINISPGVIDILVQIPTYLTYPHLATSTIKSYQHSLLTHHLSGTLYPYEDSPNQLVSYICYVIIVCLIVLCFVYYLCPLFVCCMQLQYYFVYVCLYSQGAHLQAYSLLCIVTLVFDKIIIIIVNV